MTILTPSSKITEWIAKLQEIETGEAETFIVYKHQAEDIKALLEVLLEAKREAEGREEMEREHEESVDLENKGVPSLMDEAEQLGATQDKETGEWQV